MKRFEDLTDAELLEMAAQEGNIEDLIDLECAHQGIPLLPAMMEEPKKPEFKKDVTIYVVGSFKFFNQGEAMGLIDVLNTCSLTDTTGWGNSERLYPLSDYNNPKMETKQIYSEALYSEIEKDLKAYENLKDQYELAKREYDVVKTQRDEVSDDIWDKIKEIQAQEYKKEMYKDRFNRYLTLANGDRKIALNFLNNAFPDAVNYPEIQDLVVEGDVK
jgi:hypothetical protein